MSHFEKRVQLNKIIESQLPEFLVADFPKAVEFFRQYYISQEHQGGSIDLVDNLDNYIKVDNLVPEVVVGKTSLSADITESSTTISVSSTKGFPEDYGLLKIGDEIITYTSKTETTFEGCIRGFSGITGYNVGISSFISEVNKQNVVFSTSSAAAHSQNVEVKNLSVLFLQEFYKKLKRTFTPGLEDIDFVSDLNVGNFVKHARNFYQAKGIKESVKILFKVLYGVEARVIDLETRLVKPSSANYIRREIVVAENISGDPFKLKGQTIYKSNDEFTNASVSEVEVFTRNNVSYYRLGLFVGYSDRDLVEGIFTVPGNSKALETISAGSSIISVDSTIGFPESGTLISGSNTIQYTSKSINQFFGCTGVSSTINLGDNIRSNETIYGYEDGDITKRVDLRITGVLSNLVPLGEISLIDEDEEITVKNVGEVIDNPEGAKTYKQIFANSWIYNTSARYKVSSIVGSTFTLSSYIDKSSLKVGDKVDVLVRNSNTVSSADATVNSINQSTKQVILGNLSGFTPLPTVNYDIRRKIKKSTSSGVPLLLGNSKYISDTLNVYTNDLSTYGYVASNSLPSYEINDEIIESSLPDGTDVHLDDYDTTLKTYSIIKFASNVKFIDGDRVTYVANNALAGLVSGETYFVKVVAPNQIRLYISKSLLSGTAYVRFGPNTNPGTHLFTLKRHENKTLSPNKILRKFPLDHKLSSSKKENRSVRNIGILVDGVEISSPESRNRVYYGPLTEFEVLNGGKDYDVVNPPVISISAGAGTTALVEPIISGSVKEVFVDPQDFDVNSVFSITLTGGNGSGCALEPVIGDRFREIEFDSRDLLLGGGIDTTDETITFKSAHNLSDGQHIIYNENGNSPISTGTFGDITNTVTGSLISGDEYVAKIVNTTSIKLYNNDSDASAGINTIGFTTTTSSSGIHKFRTLSKKTLRSIKVLSPGSGYQYKKLRVTSSGISTEYNTVTFKNHGFETGEIVTYSTTGGAIAGLSTSDQYSIQKLDSDTFRLINVGSAGTVTTDLVRSKYSDLVTVGSGYHIFQYPEITITTNVSYGSTLSSQFVITPIITGEITGAYLYEKGTGYGSDILNLHKKPTISLKNGKGAQLNAVISNGRIVDVQVLSKGSEYYSIPEIVADDSGSGAGAILRPVINNGRIDDVIVINGGLGYNPNTTNLYVNPRGSNAIFDVRVRDLAVNDAKRFGEFAKTRTPKIFSNLYQNDTEDSIVYGIYGYSEDLADTFGDDGSLHSPIIGWAYDGNPIYGPYGYKNPQDVQSGVGILIPGYGLNSSNIEDRPSTSSFASGFFVEDYEYNNSGDLDEHNGRFCKTPEFPNGVYAYFAGVTTSILSNKLEPLYPYFVGNTFKSEIIQENYTLDQSFDFNNSDLVRNTFPYKVNDPNANYDFFVESYEDYDQITNINSITKGEINSVEVIDGGTGYRIGESVKFDEIETGGTGFRAEVSELIGKDIDSLVTSREQYENCVFVWDSDRQVSAYYLSGFDLLEKDTVLVSGLSTSINNLSGSKVVGFTTDKVGLAGTAASYGPITGGTIQDIFLKGIPLVSIGGSAIISSSTGVETVKVLNNYNNGVLRVKRFASTGVAHSLGSDFNVVGDRITLSVKTSKFDSKRNDLVYFNAKDSVGIGTTAGGAVSKTFVIGNVSDTISIPHRSIYVPNHPFKTGQRVTFTKSDVAGIDSLIVGNDDTNLNTFQIPNTATLTSDVYVINKGRNYIGLATQVGLTTNTEGLFFYSDGTDNSEYLLKSNKTQVLGDVDRVTTLVSTASSHGLEVGDEIKLTLRPNTVVGFGTTAALSLSLDPVESKLLVNAIGINSSQINTSTNTITITNHGYSTGDKIHYNSIEVASGLSTGSYYVIKDNDNTFRLAETLYETNPKTEKVVNIVGTGHTYHTFALINPKINVIRNSDLKFNLDDPSLVGYDLKIFRDKEFKDEFVSSLDTSTFNVSGVGSAGVGTSYVLLSYSNNIPTKLYYTLEKSGYISTSDIDVSNYSEINYVDSEYNGTYKVFGISTNTFKVSPTRVPLVLNYAKDQADVLEYTTKSSTAINGSIGKVKILSKGFNFKKLPKFIEVDSQDGVDANVVALSTSVGNIKGVNIRDVGYEYPSDKTLRPTAAIPPVVRVDNLDSIDTIDIEFGGARYLSAPDLILFNETTKEVVDTTSLVASAPNGSVAEVTQLAPIYGLDSEPHKIISINNSNGVGISSMITSNSGVATCTLKTPILGFVTPQFKNGDEIYVEGIELIGSGIGYNSADYDYRFFKVQSYVNSNPAQLTFALVDDAGVGLTTNPGIAKTFQSGYATIINKGNYPVINVIKKRGVFLLNENLFVNTGTGFFETDLSVSSVREDFIKTKGRYILKKGDKIKGKVTGVIADVTSIFENKAKFEIDYASKQDIGWNSDSGKISEDYQVIPDNDYYQNLSYSIKSPITWNELSTPVNSVLHPAGMKNFADVGITSVASSRVGLAGSSNALVVLDVIEEKRVDVINNYDNTVDIDTRSNPVQSKFLKIQNKKLTDYTECRSNRVLIHDDVSDQFSNKDSQDTFIEVEEIDILDTNVRYTIQIVDPDTLDSQLTELVLQSTSVDTFLFEKSTSYTNVKLGDFTADVDVNGRKTLIFTPTDPLERDHDIKVLKKTFITDVAGIGTESIGSVDLTGSVITGVTTVGTSSSIKTLIDYSDTNFNGLFANIEILDKTTNSINYIEATLDFDGTNTYISEYYFDNATKTYSSSQIGIVTSIYDSVSGIVSFSIQNDSETSNLDIRSNIVGFAATTAGIGTYRFLVTSQPAGTEKSARLESTVGFGTTSIRVGTFDVNSINSVSSVVRVSAGSSSAIHQVHSSYNGRFVTVTPGVYAPANNVTGLGTFGGEISGSEFYLVFYPDSGYDIEAQALNEVFYRESDFDNNPLDLEYGSTNQSLFLTSYDGINGTRGNKDNFTLSYQGTPIYKKTFTPSNSTTVNLATGLFTINNHFFNTGEELIYTPNSTFIGIGKSAMGIGATANYLGIVTDRLPERVYPIVLSPDTFKLSTQKSYAQAGIFVTFTDVGVGNAHDLEFTNKLSKTVISLDGIVQQPLAFTPISHSLDYNSGSINSGISTFNLSGISSIQPKDVLKIDDEYMKVVEVGFSTNVGGSLLGPINGIIQAGAAATFPTVSVVRASFGTTAISHNDGANVQIYRGAMNIVGSKVHFASAPKGNTRARRNQSNLPYVKSQFSGRTFLRSNYDTNMLFDDVSDQFTGIGKTYTMSVQGINTTGVDNGNGILFINGVFQTPSTLNNSGNNYEFENDSVAGISSVVFTGITSTDGTYIKSDFDVNQNQLPRGGLIVSLGSTPGLGYAPLVGAKVKADIGGSGELIDVVGVNTYRNPVAITTASYDKVTGIIDIETTTAHNLLGGDRVQLVGLHFTCPGGSGITTTIFPDHDRSFDIVNIISSTELTVQVGASTITHSYVGFGSVFKHYSLNVGSGYREPVSIGVTDLDGNGSGAVVSATVGAGGTLTFSIDTPGSGYTNPVIEIPQPVYENLEVIGVSRLGIGQTTDTGSNLLMNVKIGSASTTVGIGSTLFLVESFEISRSGYAFQVGDVFKPVGLVTAKGFAQPVSEFQLEVVETFNDRMSAWSFGEMDYIDSIALRQNGSRTRFPLYYNGQLLSFEIDPDSIFSSVIDLDSLLIIFVNGVLQQPGVAYQFSGGTSFIFSEPPKESDKVDIFFYVGQEGVDVVLIDINETIKIGDDVFVKKHPLYPSTQSQLRERTISDIVASDSVETDIYVGNGIDEVTFKPFDWIKQKRDKYIKGDIIYKTRDSIEPMVYPTAKIIGDLNADSTDIFVDDAQFFNFEENNYGITINDFDALVVDVNNPVSAAFTATVSIAGTISAITTTNVGLGYSVATLPVKFSAPSRIGVGIGTTASGTATIVNGSVTSVSIDNAGFGYTSTNPPQLIIEIPKASNELIKTINNVQGFSGIITGITTTTGTGGHPLALKINFRANASDANDLVAGYPILVYNTTVGTGLTSVNSEDTSTVGIGTQFLDNIYIVNSKSNNGPDAEIICNIHTNSNVVGIATTGSAIAPILSLGSVSWGRIYNYNSRTNPISIGVTGLVVDSGLSTFPTIQRRKFGLRNNGSIRKLSNNP